MAKNEPKTDEAQAPDDQSQIADGPAEVEVDEAAQADVEGAAIATIDVDAVNAKANRVVQRVQDALPGVIEGPVPIPAYVAQRYIDDPNFTAAEGYRVWIETADPTRAIKRAWHMLTPAEQQRFVTHRAAVLELI